MVGPYARQISHRARTTHCWKSTATERTQVNVSLTDILLEKYQKAGGGGVSGPDGGLCALSGL